MVGARGYGRDMRSDARRARWEARTELPLIGAAVIFLGAYAWPILDPDLSETAADACLVTNLAIWVVFAADFGVRLALAERRGRFVVRHWLDVLVLALPMLRPLRVLRAVVALNLLARRGHAFARGRVVAAVAAAITVIGLIAALAILDAERGNPEANIRNYGDAVWWAIATATTVGYGDRYPTTTEGRYVAIGLMVLGIALLGVVTAALASWFVERMAETEQAEQRVEAQVAALTAEVRALRAELARRE